MKAETLTGGCGDNLTWSLDTKSGVLTISGTGAMADYYDVGGAPWYSHRSKIKTATISSSVTSIGKAAFWGCSGLTSVTIPNSVTSIGERAFAVCRSLKSVTIGSGVTNIGKAAFWFCTGLTSVTLGDGVTSIGEWAFQGCSSLKGFTVSQGNAGYSAKGGVLFNKAGDILISYPNAKAATYVIPNGVISIGNYAFAWCSGLTGVTIGSGVTSIGEWAFQGCSSLKGFTVSQGNAGYSAKGGVLFN
jgi:hypothetical protein